MKLIFLDIDGVLNGHLFMREAQSCNIRLPCVKQLNRIIRETGAKVVLSSAWRYMIHGKSMTLDGFAYMLRTHGFRGTDNLIGLTIPDELCPHCGHDHRRRNGPPTCKFNHRGYRVCIKCNDESTRGAQITRWLKQHGKDVERYVVLDDCDLGIREEGHPLIQTHPARGLTPAGASKAIEILGRDINAKRARRESP